MAFNSFAVIGSTIFGGSNGLGVYRSDDNGDSWHAVNTGVSHSVTLLVADGTRLYAGSDCRGVFLSENLGETWKKITLGAGLVDLCVSGLDAKGDTIIAGSIFQGIYLSKNKGLTWEPFTQGLDSSETFVTALSINGSVLHAAVAGSIYMSTFNKPLWTKVATLEEPGFIINTLAIEGDIYLAGSTTKGVFKSDEGEVWHDANYGMPNGSTFGSIAVDGNTILVTVHEDGIYRTRDKGNTWTKIRIDSSVASSYTTDLFFYNGLLFVGTWENGVFRSGDHGDTWVPANAGISDQFVYAFGAIDPYVFVALDDGVFRTSNNGDTWTQVNTGLPGLGWLEASSFTTYHGKLYAGLYGGDGDDYKNVYVTSDYGNSWSGIEDYFDDVMALTVIGNYLFAGTRNGVFRYEDTTGQWTLLPNESPDYMDKITLEVAAFNNVLFCGSYGRSFISYDFGETWNAITDGLSNTVEVFDFLGPDVLAGPKGGGMFINSSLFTRIKDFQPTVREIRIYPNPASNSVTIESTGLSGNGLLSITNANGQRVHDQFITALQTRVGINHLPAGVYFVRITDGLFTSVGKWIKA